jgi:hypothetical protein
VKKMTIEDRLEQLEEAHRALAAEHTALLEICKIMLPLIPADPVRLGGMLTITHDTISSLMQERGIDAEYQSAVRKAFDILSARILGVASSSDDRKIHRE